MRVSSFISKATGLLSRSQRVATIDAANAAPPPSPLAPVDLTDPQQVAGVMELAARIGDILLSSGNSNSDVRTQIHTVTTAYGLYDCQISITHTIIQLYATIGVDRRTPVSVVRVVRGMSTDFSRLADVDRLIRSIQAGATPPEVAEQIITDIERRPMPYGPRTSIFGWALMGGAASVMLGGGTLVGVTAFITAALIMSVSYFLTRHQLPYFFQAVAGGIIATLPAAGMYSAAASAGLQFSPSQIVGSGIIVLLAGLTLVQSLQDGITGAPVTASARFFETLLFTGAIVAGVGIGIELAQAAGFPLPPMETVANPNFQSNTVKVAFSALTVVGFAIASYAEWSSVVTSGLTALFGSFFFYFVLLPANLGDAIASAVAAVIIGLAGGLLARRFLVPPLITAIAGITPFLPGLTVYRGMYAALHDQLLVGFANIILALAIACGLASGVVLGEWIARRIKRPPKFRPYRYLRRRRSAFAQKSPHKEARKSAKNPQRPEARATSRSTPRAQTRTVEQASPSKAPPSGTSPSTTSPSPAEPGTQDEPRSGE